MASRAPKQWQLTKSETITSYENWRQNLLYILSLDNSFAEFLQPEFQWGAKTAAHPTRQLENTIDDQERLLISSQQKSVRLDMMLGQIANFCPVISRNTIVKKATCMEDIWKSIRSHYGFQYSGGQFLDLANFKMEADEKPEDLFQRLTAFFEDNLLTRNYGVSHNGSVPEQDEDMTPSLENTIVVMWLQLIHPGLPQLVRQRYGTELRGKTVSSIRSEISMSLDSLLDELKSVEDSRILRASFDNRRNFRKPSGKFSSSNSFKSNKSCTLCKAVGRANSHTHYLSSCPFLPESDKKAMQRMSRVRQAACLEEEDSDLDVDHEDLEVTQSTSNMDSSTVRRVNCARSPFLDVYYDQFPTRVTLDTGAESNLIRYSFAKQAGIPITRSQQMARQADGRTPMKVIGEANITLTLGVNRFKLDAMVVEQLDVDILAGEPFMESNDIGVRPALKQIHIQGKQTIYYDHNKTNSADKFGKKTAIRRLKHFSVPNHNDVIFPGDVYRIELPREYVSQVDAVAIEPVDDYSWPPHQIVDVSEDDDTISLYNDTKEPIFINQNIQLCAVRAAYSDRLMPIVKVSTPNTVSMNMACSKEGRKSACSSKVSVDPENMLTNDLRSKFILVNSMYEEVFDPKIGVYNDASGQIRSTVSMGKSQPPQRKGRLPMYGKKHLIELQKKFDDLEELGVFVKPEAVGVHVEYLNPSFLIKKNNGGFRLVTNFTEIGQYTKPQPSLLPNIDETLRKIALWRYLCITDLSSSYYQIHLDKPSMKYCGVATPFKGIRVYARSAMGMPGSESTLEELMCRVLGDMLFEGKVAKLADDLYCGGSTAEEALENWSELLRLLHINNLRLAAHKTVICPASTTILGWLWAKGSIQASPHKIMPLSSCDPPQTVKSMRSFIGSYKALSKVIPHYSDWLAPLEDMIAGKNTSDKLHWCDKLLQRFSECQQHLDDRRAIVIPTPSDHLTIVTDASVSKSGISSILYLRRNNQYHIGGFFSAKLRKHQTDWLPCEIEACAISASVKHFSPYIIQSDHPVQILSDSKPCVQAYEKMKRGEFSASSRVSTFLSIVSQYQCSLQHIRGSSNLVADYGSRQPAECREKNCQICKFVHESIESVVVRNVSVANILNGSAKVPYANRNVWLSAQLDCNDLRRVHSHLKQGTRPGRKLTKIKNVKRYLQQITIAKDGLLIVRKEIPFQPSSEQIVVPDKMLHGLLTALHIQLHHPSKHQLKQFFSRHYFALNSKVAIDSVTSNCHVCESLKKLPKESVEQSTSSSVKCVGSCFAADVLKRNKQLILVVRETVTSFTTAKLVKSETQLVLREALVQLTADIQTMGDTPVTIRVDSAPGLAAMNNDEKLKNHGIVLEFGRVKNVNKNPVAERAVQELIGEFLKMDPAGGPVTEFSLSLAIARLNSRIRHTGMSAREMFYQRSQFTGGQLDFTDENIGKLQLNKREDNHMPSALSKSNGASFRDSTLCVNVGDLVYLKGDGSKYHSRKRYIVSSTENARCQVKLLEKAFGSRSYDVSKADVYKVPGNTPGIGRDASWHDDEEDDDSDYEEEERQLVVNDGQMGNEQVYSGRPQRIRRKPDRLIIQPQLKRY